MGDRSKEGGWFVVTDPEEELFAILEALDATVWLGRGINQHAIEEWLKGFGADGSPGSPSRLQALYLLSRFTYFGPDEVRALAGALHRDCFRYPAVAQIRRDNGHTRDLAVINTAFSAWLKQTRFLGMGNPSESGVHILYHYRQESDLNSRLFINPDEILDLSGPEPQLADPSIKRYVFIDDFCGSGVQAIRYSKRILGPLTKAATSAGMELSIAYHVLVGTGRGLSEVRTKTAFTEVRSALELDDTFRTFGDSSRYFGNVEPPLSKDGARDLAHRHGAGLLSSEPLGFGDGQLMLGFAHNTPNNTLPIFWHTGSDSKAWSPPFRRHGKITIRLGSAS
jgi:hypothetical protein